MTVFASTFVLSFHFLLYKQTLALAVSSGLLWHVSCHLPSEKIMIFVALLVKVEITE